MSTLNCNNKYTPNEISFAYLPRTECLKIAEAVPRIQPAEGSDPRLYTRCVKCGIVFPGKKDNVFTTYY